MDTQKQFNSSLVEVRKAFRLLYMYQKRVLDIVTFIKDYWGLEFDTGMPWPVSHITGNTKGKNVNFEGNPSPWVWLPMYYYDFFF